MLYGCNNYCFKCYMVIATLNPNPVFVVATKMILLLFSEDVFSLSTSTYRVSQSYSPRHCSALIRKLSSRRNSWHTFSYSTEDSVEVDCSILQLAAELFRKA